MVAQMSVNRDAISGFNRAQWQAELGPLLRLWEQLMASGSALRSAIKELGGKSGGAGALPAQKAGKEAGTSPIDDFVSLERSNGVKLVMLIDSSLGALSRVLKGTETLSSSVQKLGAALLTDQVCLGEVGIAGSTGVLPLLVVTTDDKCA
jgi:dynein heavy chain 2